MSYTIGRKMEYAMKIGVDTIVNKLEDSELRWLLTSAFDAFLHEMSEMRRDGKEIISESVEAELRHRLSSTMRQEFDDRVYSCMMAFAEGDASYRAEGEFDMMQGPDIV